MHFTLIQCIDGRCWVYRDQLGQIWTLGFRL